MKIAENNSSDLLGDSFLYLSEVENQLAKNGLCGAARILGKYLHIGHGPVMNLSKNICMQR